MNSLSTFWRSGSDSYLTIPHLLYLIRVSIQFGNLNYSLRKLAFLIILNTYVVLEPSTEHQTSKHPIIDGDIKQKTVSVEDLFEDK